MHPAFRAAVGGMVTASVWLALSGGVCGQPPGLDAREKADAARKKAREDARIALGRALFVREWVPDDRRTHGGDGLGPVFNDRSCLGCHHQGPTGGGGGSAATNIELITAVPAGAVASGSNGFYYAFSFNYGPDGFEYHIGEPPGLNANANANRGRRDARRHAGAAAPNVAELVRIHPGFRDAPSVVLHRYGNDADYRSWREWVLGDHGAIAIRTSQRNPTPLYGLGQVDAIPDEAIEAEARRRHPGWPQVNGRVARLADGRVGRFGWKGQTANLRDFVLSAAAVELGLEVPGHAQAGDPRIPPIRAKGLDLDQDECDALTAFVRSLPAPTAARPDGQRTTVARKLGRSLFRSTGCAACHVEKLGEVEGLYSDLLLHAMSPDLSDTSSYKAFQAAEPPAPAPARVVPAGARGGRANRPPALEEWRTPPLWGLRDSAPYLHDGRAATIDEAIRLHGGEASASAQRYRQLTDRERSLLQGFLLSLAAPDVPDLR